MEPKLMLFLLADLALMASGYFYGWKFLKKRNFLLGAEWWIIAISATSFFVYALTEMPPFYKFSIFLDAFSRSSGFPVIAVIGGMAVTHDYRPSRLIDGVLFALGFVGAYVLVTAEFVAPIKPWLYLALGLWFALFVVYFAKRLLAVGERLQVLNLLLVMATSLTIAVIYDFFKIPGDDEYKTIFYTIAMATWAYLLFGFYHAYCALERAEKNL